MHFTGYSTRLAAYAVLVDDREQILLTWFNGGSRRAGAGWSLPGGGVDFDEGIRAGLVREVHEETGYAVRVGELLAEHHFTGPAHERDGRPFRSQRLVFAAEIVGGELGTTEVGGTTDFARWVPLADLAAEPLVDIVRLGVRAWQGRAHAERHRLHAGRLTQVVGGVSDWDAPTPVAEWTARDVVGHLVGWLPGFLAAGCDVVLETGPSVAQDPVGAWAHHRDQVQALLEDPDLAHRTYRHDRVPDAPLGEVVDRFYTTDVFLHTWDLARASGQDDTLDPPTVAQLYDGLRAAEEVIRASGQFGKAQPVPDDAGLQDRLVALIGRDPGWRPPGRGPSTG
ncbi:TIGR03086 family metal-binding protein [Ornithinimicrobium flavum]|uniref:TIGR03086 family metal-binding protein n=1 Tax=Ornithinimicrobium flavum TaxID=1288636 RepID=UPI001EE8E880|nr:TIGR03086 family metal-binding protein [Ornithinimicrobium flavum]